MCKQVPARPKRTYSFGSSGIAATSRITTGLRITTVDSADDLTAPRKTCGPSPARRPGRTDHTGPAWQRCIAVCGLLLWVFSGAVAAANITGQATYRERIALPPEAIFEAVLEDISQASAVRIADIRMTNPGPPPIAFTLRYDA